MRRALPFRLLVPKCFVARFSGKLLWLVVSVSKEGARVTEHAKGLIAPLRCGMSTTSLQVYAPLLINFTG